MKLIFIIYEELKLQKNRRKHFKYYRYSLKHWGLFHY